MFCCCCCFPAKLQKKWSFSILFSFQLLSVRFERLKLTCERVIRMINGQMKPMCESQMIHKMKTWREESVEKNHSHTPTYTLWVFCTSYTHSLSPSLSRSHKYTYTEIWKTKDIYLSILPISVIKRTNSNDIDNNLNKCLFVYLRVCMCAFPLIFLLV